MTLYERNEIGRKWISCVQRTENLKKSLTVFKMETVSHEETD